MNISQHVSLLPYNTFHLDCIAEQLVRIQNITDLEELVASNLLVDRPFLILGGGSNLLLAQASYAGVVIKNEIMGMVVDDITDTHCLVTVGAGEERDTFVQWTLLNGMCGLENLSGIPWCVWAAPVQNIGAYGEEVKTYITHVHTFDLATGKQNILTNEACHFGYRRSCFKEPENKQLCITHVQFSLPKYNANTYTPNLSYASLDVPTQETLTPHIVATAIKATRASKLPDWHILWTAWSFFKNPSMTTSAYDELKQVTPDLKGFPQSDGTIKLSAGQLIELAWFKGYRNGPVGTYDKHALVLVHHGGGTGQDLLALVKQIQDAVQKQFGVQLMPEVCIIQ